MARPRLVQPIPPINTPLTYLPDGTPLYPSPEYRISWEAESIALFGGDGSVDVTQGIAEGGIDLETGTTGNYVKQISGDGVNVVVIGGVGKGSTPTINLGTPLSAFLLAASYTATDVRAKLLTVDGAGSGVDADLLDGEQGAFYRERGNHQGTQPFSTLTALPPTLAAHGITNAYTKTETDTAVGGKVTKTAAIPAITTDMSGDAFADELKTAVNAIIAALNA